MSDGNDTRPRIDTREAAAAIVAQAYAEVRAAQASIATETFPVITPEPGEQWTGRDYGPGNGITVDLSGTGARFTRPAPSAPPAPLGAISARMVDGITYPDPHDLTGGLNPRLYAQALRHIGMATGTCSPYESDAAWRLAIETGATS